MSYDKTIYKKDSKGKIRFLRVYTIGAELIQESGAEGTDSPVEHRSVCIGKNIGKVNETTPKEQAVLEATSKVENKMSTGYYHTIQEANNEVVILPMLAKDYKKEKNKITYPCYVQPKLDGMRALYGDVGNGVLEFISRKGKAITTMSHIESEVSSSNVILDGELYAHGKNFQENMRLIKKDRGEATKEVMYHVYDLVSTDPFSLRIAELKELVHNYPSIRPVETYMVNSEEDMLKFHAQFIEEGYEGTIVRHSNAGYGVNKRDSQLLKYKDFIDNTYKVVDVVPSEKNPKQGVVMCQGTNESLEVITFGTGMKFSHKEREEILANKSDYIGQMAEVRFFEYSEDGVPRFPVTHGFRLDK